MLILIFAHDVPMHGKIEQYENSGDDEPERSEKIRVLPPKTVQRKQRCYMIPCVILGVKHEHVRIAQRRYRGGGSGKHHKNPVRIDKKICDGSDTIRSDIIFSHEDKHGDASDDSHVKAEHRYDGEQHRYTNRSSLFSHQFKDKPRKNGIREEQVPMPRDK